MNLLTFFWIWPHDMKESQCYTSSQQRLTDMFAKQLSQWITSCCETHKISYNISFPRSFNGNPSKQKRILEKCWSNLKYFSVYFLYIFSSKLLVTLSIVILIWHERLFYVGLPLKEIRPYSVHVGILFRYRIMMSAAWMLCLSPVTNNRWTAEKKWCDKKNEKKVLYKQKWQKYRHSVLR